MTANDGWERAAMADDSLVVELLLSLKHQRPPAKVPLLPFDWGCRRPRSRAANSALRVDVVSYKKEADSTRCSPTTPLSWSGGSASPSATADGFEDSSRPAVVGRSKVTSAANETTTTTAKRSRRKKTFAELKEEESLLLKERLNLKKELASLSVTCREETARNDKLKRIKLDLGVHSTKDTLTDAEESREIKLEQHSQNVASTYSLPRPDASSNLSAPGSCQSAKSESNGGSSFLLPDLNAMPAEDDSTCEVLYGIS